MDTEKPKKRKNKWRHSHPERWKELLKKRIGDAKNKRQLKLAKESLKRHFPNEVI